MSTKPGVSSKHCCVWPKIKRGEKIVKPNTEEKACIGKLDSLQAINTIILPLMQVIRNKDLGFYFCCYCSFFLGGQGAHT